MEERREMHRREADRMMVDKLRALNDGKLQDHLKRKRRRAIRHDCRASIRMEVLSKSGSSETWSESAQTVKARVLDLSETGASLFSQIPLNAGQATQISIGLPDGAVLECAAEVRWAKEKQAKGGFATGVRFINLGAQQEARVTQFLADLDRTLGL